MTHHYTPLYRAPSFTTVPPGWTLVERGTYDVAPLRSDLPLGTTRFGVISYPDALPTDAVEAFQLQEVIR
jgi:hypothetical protein